MKKISIIIPSYNHLEDCLKPCIDSILKYTSCAAMLDMEIIISANGCTDGTKEYLESLTDSQFRYVWSDESLGYTKALNEGIKISTGEFLIYLNNDTEFLPQELDTWINQLLKPFDDPKVGASGPLILYDRYADVQTLIFFCAMVRRSLIDIIGLPDEIYSPGGGEDIDFCAKAQLAGYKIVQVPEGIDLTFTYTNVGGFPIWHKDNQTFKDIPEYTNWIVKRNGLLNAKRYNKHIKLNLGSGGIHIPGYLSVDNFDPRTHILMDATKLDFEDNTVEEIIASHLFEHISPYKAVDTLKEWLRVLKPGCKLIMEMPDFEALCHAFITAPKGERYGILNAVYGTINTSEVGKTTDIPSPHLWGWYPEMLFDHIMWAGFENVQFMKEQIPHPGHNFRVEATKPSTLSLTFPGIDVEDLKRQDSYTFDEIFKDNSYGITKEDIAGKRVLDIGANIGLFTSLCASYGATKIVSVEACPEVYQGLIHNTKNLPQALPLNWAVYNTSGETVKIKNENVASCISDEGSEVETVTINDLLKLFPADDKDMFLKIDCEGSEYPILLSTTKRDIRRFKTVVMEVHWELNKQSTYRGKDRIINKMTSFGFELVYTNQMFGGEPRERMPVEIERWERI